MVDLGNPVQRLAHIAAAACVLEEDERGLRVTVSVWPTFSRTAVGSDTVLESRRPRISGHSEASCTPYAVGNHTRVRPARGRVMRSTSPSTRSRVSRHGSARYAQRGRSPGALLGGGHPVLRQHPQRSFSAMPL
ncbi:hypothetical protein GCM10023084_80480 [Streptomyces lacrimifluminis]|uniref:Uncharacterized protein n=1 Tax=Streptomyces lacrimifluminis TaxID=1500077 RepID=A0A917PC46_9ACTN|nr:hypothetical protein GCM10012282_79240 [Streptomyces lacrimifluminis]